MDWRRVFVYFLVVSPCGLSAEVATSNGEGRTDSNGSPVARITADYFQGTNFIVTRERQSKFLNLFNRFASHPDLRQSTAALEKALAFYVKQSDGIQTGCGGTQDNHKIQGDWIVITDYTLPITSPRQFYVNLRTGDVRKSYAAHGGGSNYASATSPVRACPAEHVISCGRGASACAIPISFDDVSDSNKTETGFFLSGDPYRSAKATFQRGQPPSAMGETNGIILHGAVRSTRNAESRGVVYHRASYVPPVTAGPSQCGFSWGCPSTDPQTFESIKDELVEGTLFYNHTIQEETTVNPSC